MKKLITICSLLMMGLVATSCSSAKRTEETTVVTDTGTMEKRETKRTTSSTAPVYEDEATSSGRGR